MTFANVLGLIAVGVVAGVVSTVVSLASVISYPALLAFGLPPLSANVTNTVSLVFTGLGAVAGSRPELADQGGRLRRLGGMSITGGATGAALLLVTPPSTFEAVAPWLIVVASLLLLCPPRLEALTGSLGGGHLLRAGVFVVSIYVGYFGAAGGILMLAVLSSVLRDAPARLNAVKNVLSGLANAVAAIAFALFGPVQWAAAVPLAAGFLVGGRLGPVLARRLPGRSLRVAAAVSGLLVAVKLGLDTYL
ncbi:sulfite exporter TauE/SafE family protein [Sphaerisporangium perillae]|uniref:sulfite exporter TauE/SafE family protein n=1 Tax=Sphaerisporangium perillae TaxID=2935860 RepID=UPI00200F68B5|nr:sulfite exporter TauE/SafE family protein [Sphaerisporangium perillae]